MENNSHSRFTSQNSHNQTTQERLSSNTIGLVSAADYRKRRAEVLEAQEREARSGASTPDVASAAAVSDSSSSAQPVKKKPKKKAAAVGKKLLSFGHDEDEEEDGNVVKKDGKIKRTADGEDKPSSSSKFKPNASVSVLPKVVTKAALLKEAAEREALRQEFLIQRDSVKSAEIAIPFIFYDGANIPGGVVRVKKGDFIWFFLDKSRKVGARRAAGEKTRSTKVWARVGVDDLMLVRGTIIIPHHYDFYFFLANKSLGPDGQRIFNYSSEAPGPVAAGLLKPETAPDITSLEGADDDPTMTKVVDRRWYEKNKHIYPASTWQTFDAEKDYLSEVRRDTGGNAFFFSR